MPILAQLIGQPVSHAWFGDYSSLYLEIGELRSVVRGNGTLGNPKGSFTVYAGFNWRLERRQSILGSSSDSAHARAAMVNTLLNSRISSMSTTGRIPELQIGFSNGVWLTTFNLSKGQPDWNITFGEERSEYVYIERGKLVIDRRDIYPPKTQEA